jgi:hypothetical protein
MNNVLAATLIAAAGCGILPSFEDEPEEGTGEIREPAVRTGEQVPGPSDAGQTPTSDEVEDEQESGKASAPSPTTGWEAAGAAPSEKPKGKKKARKTLSEADVDEIVESSDPKGLDEIMKDVDGLMIDEGGWGTGPESE